MNRHNFLQFNPNCYKKHLSPFGQNVLTTLIRHWRTGIDQHRQQLIANQTRRNTRGFYGDSRPIPSVPSSPVREVNYDERENLTTNNFVTDDYFKPKVSVDQASDGEATSIGETNNEKDIHPVTPRFNNDHFAMPRVPGQVSGPSIDKTHYSNYRHTNYVKDVEETQSANSNFLTRYQNDHRQNDDVLPDIPIKQILRDITHHALSNTLVPASDELIKTVEIANTNEEEILTANDIITPAINFDKINENLFLSKKYVTRIDCKSMPAMEFLETLNKETNKTILTRDEVITNRGNGRFQKDVEWDDMFDTELFTDVKGPEQINAPFENDTCKNFKIEFLKDKERKQITSNAKVIKRKIQMKISDSLAKKVKKVKNDVEKTVKKSIRKEKYSKVVKNWLENVDPNNFVKDKDGIPKTAITHETINRATKFDDMSNAFLKNRVPSIEKIIIKNLEVPETKTVSHEALVGHGAKEINRPETSVTDENITIKVSSDIEIEKIAKRKNKKVIQARLAQKDGKMKYGLPDKEQNKSKTELVEKDETKSKEKTKEKKVKAKFVAPVKSQIPVKNIEFNVNTINDNSFHLIHDVIESEDNDITMMLIYSNGFCQLNNHHTEETCVPEGIMVQSSDKFFYIKDNIQKSDLLRLLLEKSHVICYNAKQLLIYLTSKYDIELKQDVFNLSDAKIGGSLIDPDNPPENFTELQKLIGFVPEFTIATECAIQKAAWYTTLLRQCFEKLKSLLQENSVWSVFVDIEMPLLPVIAGMEYRGVCVDLEKLKSMEEILLNNMKAAEHECYKAAGKTFQINSALQVRTILYDELQLDTKSNLKIKETIGKGAKSTSETMLRGLVSVHPLPRLILEYRHLHKAHATFLAGIAQHVKDGEVRPTWVQTAAATGRIASNNPNLQAIPKAPFSLVMFPETSDAQEAPLNFRCVYTARAQHWLVAADFKHVECRVFAHAAADAALLDALRSGQDLFRVLAAKWLNKPAEEVSSEDRERTKRIVYASLYGAGARKLMEILSVGYEQALAVMSSFNRTFPALKAFGRAVAARAAQGALRSLRGRARRFPRLASADAALRAQAERQAVNFVVQGSAADLCKKAMVAVQRRLEQPPRVRALLVLQIHDELVWEVADDDVDRAAVIIKEAMENVGVECGMGMALPVELTRGRNWGEMRPFSPDIQQPAHHV